MERQKVFYSPTESVTFALPIFTKLRIIQINFCIHPMYQIFSKSSKKIYKKQAKFQIRYSVRYRYQCTDFEETHKCPIQWAELLVSNSTQIGQEIRRNTDRSSFALLVKCNSLSPFVSNSRLLDNVKNSYMQFNENATNGSVANTRSQADRYTDGQPDVVSTKCIFSAT